MLCKVVNAAADVEPVSWQSVIPHSGASTSATLFAVPAPPSATPDKVATLRPRLAELERARQPESAQIRQKAFQEGLQQARAEGAAEVKAATDKLAQTVLELANVKRKLRADAESELLNLSLAVARRILHRELATDPEALQGLVHASLQKLKNREISCVRVYPAGGDALKAALERLGAAPAIKVIPDPALKCGDLIFETCFGDLDASVDSQLAEIQRGFTDRLSQR